MWKPIIIVLSIYSILLGILVVSLEKDIQVGLLTLHYHESDIAELRQEATYNHNLIEALLEAKH